MRNWLRRHLPWRQRRWIPDPADRNDHEAVVRERLKRHAAELTSPEQGQPHDVASEPTPSLVEEIDRADR